MISEGQAAKFTAAFPFNLFFRSIELMDPNTLLFLIVAIASLSFLFEQVLEYVNLKSLRTDIPADVARFYEPGRYVKSLQYHVDILQRKIDAPRK